MSSCGAGKCGPRSCCLLTSLTSLRLRHGRSAKKSTSTLRNVSAVRRLHASFTTSSLQLLCRLIVGMRLQALGSSHRISYLLETSSHLHSLLPKIATASVVPRCHPNAARREPHQKAVQAMTQAPLHRKRQCVGAK